MEALNTPIFAQAKVEYTKQLIEILYPHIFDGVKSIQDESKVIYSTKTATPILLLFRELLEKVPIWNSEIIDTECDRIINNSNCDWIDDLITAVFIIKLWLLLEPQWLLLALLLILLVLIVPLSIVFVK